MLYFIGAIILIILYILFSRFVSGYKQDKLFNPIIVRKSSTISSLKTKEYPASIINRSEDKKSGIEFTYTSWVKINDNIIDDTNKYYNLFLKGENKSDSFDPSQCPGVWVKSNLTDNTNSNNSKELQLIINFDTFLIKNQEDIECKNLEDDCNKYDHCDDNIRQFEKQCNEIKDATNCNNMNECKYIDEKVGCSSYCHNKMKESIVLDNIPYGRSFHLAIIVRNKEIDVYINGNLYNTFLLKNVIKQNHANLKFGYSNKNYDSLSNTTITDFRYFNYAIPYYRLDNLIHNSKNNLSIPVEKENEFKPYLNRKYWTGEDTNYNTYNQEIMNN